MNFCENFQLFFDLYSANELESTISSSQKFPPAKVSTFKVDVPRQASNKTSDDITNDYEGDEKYEMSINCVNDNENALLSS
jgi:hypothetical protein